MGQCSFGILQGGMTFSYRLYDKVGFRIKFTLQNKVGLYQHLTNVFKLRTQVPNEKKTKQKKHTSRI